MLMWMNSTMFSRVCPATWNRKTNVKRPSRRSWSVWEKLRKGTRGQIVSTSVTLRRIPLNLEGSTSAGLRTDFA